MFIELNKFGAGLTIDGAFGTTSQTATKNFQSKMGKFLFTNLWLTAAELLPF